MSCVSLPLLDASASRFLASSTSQNAASSFDATNLSNVQSDNDIVSAVLRVSMSTQNADVEDPLRDTQDVDLVALLGLSQEERVAESSPKHLLNRENSMSSGNLGVKPEELKNLKIPSYRRLQSFVGKPEGFDLFSNDIAEIDTIEQSTEQIAPTLASPVGQLPDPKLDMLPLPLRRPPVPTVVAPDTSSSACAASYCGTKNDNYYLSAEEETNVPGDFVAGDDEEDVMSITTSLSSEQEDSLFEFSDEDQPAQAAPAQATMETASTAQLPTHQRIKAIKYYPGIDLALGESGWDLLRSTVRYHLDIATANRNERAAAWKQSVNLHSASHSELLKMAFELGLWDEVIRIHDMFRASLGSASRSSGPASATTPSQASSTKRGVASSSSTTQRRKAATTSSHSDIGSVIPYQSGITLKLGGAGRELLKKNLREVLRKKSSESVKRKLEAEGIYAGSLRKSTLADLLRMAYMCGIWNEAVRLHLEFSGKLPLSSDHQAKKVEMQNRDKAKRQHGARSHRGGWGSSDDDSSPHAYSAKKRRRGSSVPATRRGKKAKYASADE